MAEQSISDIKSGSAANAGAEREKMDSIFHAQYAVSGNRILPLIWQ